MHEHAIAGWIAIGLLLAFALLIGRLLLMLRPDPEDPAAFWTAGGGDDTHHDGAGSHAGGHGSDGGAAGGTH